MSGDSATVLFIDHTSQLGGAERSMLDLLARLDRERVTPMLATSPGGPLVERAQALGVEVVLLDVAPELLELSREEVLATTPMRHPMRVGVELGADADGVLTALKVDVLSDTGAYGNHGPGVMFHGCHESIAVYRCANKRLDAEAPTHFTAPSGSNVPIDYEGDEGPRLAIRVQELFGLATHPVIAGGRVPLLIELLSPAHRPVQVTRDLPGFWRGSYRAVRTELRGRYPKHPWPDNPLTAPATRRAKPRGG